MIVSVCLLALCGRDLHAPPPGPPVQEARGMQLHRLALGHQKEGRYDEAQAAFEELLQAEFVHTASPVSLTPG